LLNDGCLIDVGGMTDVAAQQFLSWDLREFVCELISLNCASIYDITGKHKTTIPNMYMKRCTSHVIQIDDCVYVV